MNHERKLFIKEYEDKDEDEDEDEQCYDFRSRCWYSHELKFSLLFLVVIVAISFLFF